MVKKEQEICYSFVYTPAKPSCLRADGTCDYDKLNALIKAAKEGDKKAQLKVFEQYAGVWQPLCSQSEEIQYRLCMDREDFQQEVFCGYLNSIGSFTDVNTPQKLEKFIYVNCKNWLMDVFKKADKQITGHGILDKKEAGDDSAKFSYSCCSIYERNEEGDLKYDLPDDGSEKAYFQDYYPIIGKLLTEKELQIAVDSYVYGMSQRKVAEKYNLSYGYVRLLLSRIKEKLKPLDK